MTRAMKVHKKSGKYATVCGLFAVPPYDSSETTGDVTCLACRKRLGLLPLFREANGHFMSKERIRESQGQD